MRPNKYTCSEGCNYEWMCGDPATGRFVLFNHSRKSVLGGIAINAKRVAAFSVKKDKLNGAT